AREGEPRVERRAFEPPVACAQRQRKGRSRGDDRRKRQSLTQWLLRHVVTEMRLPDFEFDPLDSRPLSARQPQHEVVVMRAEPVPEEARGHGEMHDLVVHLLALDPPKPTGTAALSQLSA